MIDILLSIDLKTLILLTTLNFLTNGSFLIFIFRIRHHLFLKWLAYGCFLFALGWLLFLFRFIYGINVITLPLANILILLMPISLVFSMDAFLEYRHSKLYSSVTLFTLLFTFLFLEWSMHDKWIPGIYTSVLNGIFYFIPGFLLLRLTISKSTIIWVITGLNFLISTLLIIRAFILTIGWLYPGSIDESIIVGLLTGSLCLNIICLNSQVLCFPILDLVEAQKDLISANRKLEDLSNLDELTELPNRRALKVRLDYEVSHHIVNNVPFSIILFDLDHFKGINDKFGHLAGDSVLKQIATLVNQLVRPTDPVMRYGGEEFIVLLPETECSKAFDVAERLRVGISQFHFNHPDIPSSLQVTASFGISVLNTNSLTTNELIKRADLALYKAKTQGRNQVCIDDFSIAGKQ